MSFVDTDFLLFFPVVFIGYWLLQKRRWQNIFLLLASQVFYGWFDLRLPLLLLAVTGMNYGAAILVDRHPEQKGRILAAAALATLATLLTALRRAGIDNRVAGPRVLASNAFIYRL